MPEPAMRGLTVRELMSRGDTGQRDDSLSRWDEAEGHEISSCYSEWYAVV